MNSQNKMLPDTLKDPANIATSGEKAFMEGARLIASALAWTAPGLLTQYLSDKAEQHSPPTGHFIEIDHIRLHYLERGSGIPVVLLHGNGTMAYEFEVSSLFGLAAENYRVIAFDRPGYGYSERPRGRAWTSREQADLLAKALKALDIEQAIIVGHSWGTMVASSLALDHPECVRSLVLLSGYYYPTPRLDILLLSPPAIPGIGDVIRPTISPFIGRMIWPGFVQKLFSPEPVSARWEAEFPVWMALRPSQIHATAMETALMTVEAYWLAQRYGDFQMPLIIMAGTDDMHVATKVHSERLHQQIPHSKLVLVPGAGHMIHHVHPELVLQAIDMAVQ